MEHEKKWTATELKAATLIWALETFRPYIDGVKKCRHYLYGRHFTGQTDHQSLTHLMKSFQDFGNQRVVRWLERLL